MIDNGQAGTTASERPVSCPACLSVIRPSDAYCPNCGGTLLVDQAPGTHHVRRRLDGSSWFPQSAVGVPTPVEMNALNEAENRHQPGTRVRTRRKRHRRRKWYRRPLVIAPLTVLIVFLSAAGAIMYRAESTISAIHQLSTPPPVVTDNTVDDDPDQPTTPVQVDTGPAQAALRQAREAAGTPQATESGGIVGRIRSAASNTSELAGGAVAAAGLTDLPDVPRTILVMGVDARPGSAIDFGVRPDALMLLRLEPATRSCRLLAIPRDTRVDLPGYGQTKINHALMVGGIPFQKLMVEQFLGVSIDNYVLVDFVAFQQLVNAVGGVTVTIPEGFSHEGVTFTAGTQVLDGDQALHYARYRYDSQGDLGRIHRQWSLLQGLVRAEDQRDLVSDINEFLPTLEDHLRTDLTASELVTIARTYGGHCTATTTQAAMIDGTRVRLHDPIFNQPEYFNVVQPVTVQQRVDAFLGRPTPSREKAPAAVDRSSGWDTVIARLSPF